MNTLWRVSLACGLAVLVFDTAANAQTGGTATNAQTGGTAPNTQTVMTPTVGGLNGGIFQLGVDKEEVDDSFVGPPKPPPQKLAHFNRVTSTRRTVVAAPPRTTQPSGSAGPATIPSQHRSLHPYSTQVQQGQTKAAMSGIPTGSSWQPPPQRVQRQPMMVRLTQQTYYPNMRAGQYGNRNIPDRTRSRMKMQLRTGVSGLGASNVAPVRSGSGSGRKP